MHRDQLLADASLVAGTQRLCIFHHSSDEIQTRRASCRFQIPHQCPEMQSKHLAVPIVKLP